MKGLFDGVVKQAVSLIALFAAVFFCGEAAHWLRSYLVALGWFPEQGVTILSYILAFAMIVGLFRLAGNLISRTIDATPLSVLNHLGGGLAGLLLYLLFASVTLNVVEYIDPGSVLIPREAKVESHFYHPIVEIVPTIFPSRLFKT